MSKTNTAVTTTELTMKSESAVEDLPQSFQIDYELVANKKNRQYTIADVSTVRMAISEHIVEFLRYHKVPAYYGYEHARWFFGVLIIIAGTFSYAYKHETMADNRPLYFASSVVFLVCTLAQIYISRFVEGPTTFFLSKPFAASSSDSRQEKTSSSKKSKKKGCAGDSGDGEDPSPELVVKAFTSRIPTTEEQLEEDQIEVDRILAAREAWANLGIFSRLLAKLGLKKVDSGGPDSAVTFIEEPKEEVGAKEESDVKEENEKKVAGEDCGVDSTRVAESNAKEDKSKDSEQTNNTNNDEGASAASSSPAVDSNGDQPPSRPLIAVLAEPAKPSDCAKYVTLNKQGSVYSQPLRTYVGDRHIRLRIEMYEANPCFKLFADELIMSRGFWSPPKVVTSVEKTLAYASFFDKEGFIHPPAIKEHTMALLKELASASTNSKKRR